MGKWSRSSGQWSRHFGDLPLAASPCGQTQTYWESMIHANAIEVLSNRNATWALTLMDFGSVRHRGGHRIIYFPGAVGNISLPSEVLCPFFLNCCLILEHEEAPIRWLCFMYFNETFDHEKQVEAFFFLLYFLKLYLTNKNQDLWPSSCISKYKHNKN